MNCSFRLLKLCALLLLGLLAGCSHGAAGADDATDLPGQVAVTTVMPVQQTFHDTVEAWGIAIGDPQRARTIGLAHGGQVVAVNVVAGQVVTRGQSLLRVSPDPAAHSAWEQAQSTFTLASGELKRTEQLAAQRLATQSQLDTARKALADAQATLDAQRAIGGGETDEVVSAPDGGVITTLSVTLGERFAANAPLLGFTPAHALVAQLGVQPEAGTRLRPGLPVLVHSVYDTATNFVGTLSMIGQSIDPQTHLLNAQVELPAEAGATLVAGAALNAQISTADFSAWAVPRASVLHDEKGDYLLQVEKGHAKRIDVKQLSPDGDTVGVQGALATQVPVIVLGAYELSDGDAVQAHAAAAHAAPTSATTGQGTAQ